MLTEAMKRSNCGWLLRLRLTPTVSWRVGLVGRSLVACCNPGVTSDRASVALAAGAAWAVMRLAPSKPTPRKSAAPRRMVAKKAFPGEPRR